MGGRGGRGGRREREKKILKSSINPLGHSKGHVCHSPPPPCWRRMVYSSWAVSLEHLSPTPAAASLPTLFRMLACPPSFLCLPLYLLPVTSLISALTVGRGLLCLQPCVLSLRSNMESQTLSPLRELRHPGARTGCLREPSSTLTIIYVCTSGLACR